MKYRIDRDAGAPAYLQLYIQLRRDIVDGLFPLQAKLPSKRTMADDTGISTVTVEHAYALLCEEGYIEARQRSGYFVIFHAESTFLPSTDHELHHPIAEHHHSNINEEFPFSVLVKSMRAVISNYAEAITDKSPGKGCFVLREAIQNYLARSRGIRADSEQIIIGSGSEYLYSLIVELFGRTKSFAIESPSYKKIEQVYRASDVMLIKLPLGPNGIDSAALQACTADVLHVSPYRSYPSGVTASASKRHEYIRWANDGNRYLVEDDFESEFSILKKTEDTLFSHATSANVIYMNSFSKTVSPSLRVGYMVLPRSLLERFDERLGFYSCTVPTYVQYVLADLITNGSFERHINRVRRAKRKNK